MAHYNKQILDDEQHKIWTSERVKKLQWAQSLPLERKIAMTEWRISEAVDRFGLKNVAVSYSMGKDSGVLSHIARQLYPDILHVFANTQVEYPESMRLFRKQRNEFSLIMSLPKPGWSFKRVVEEYGYPMFSKDIARMNREYRNAKSDDVCERILQHMENHKEKYIKFLDWVRLSDKCCEVLKHGQIEKLERKMGIQCSIIATLAVESQLRRLSWVDYGCNVFENTKSPRSRPMSFWTEKDIWDYINHFKVEISDLYRKGYRRNGCMFCGFGVHLEKPPNRIQRLAWTHPSSYEYLVRNFGQYFKDCGINIKPIPMQMALNF